MEVSQLRAFHAIAATGSFSLAAEQLHLTQSALSHRIRTLEEEVGEELLVRAKPRVYPTAAGRVLLASASNVLEEIARAQRHFGVRASRAHRETLRVAATNVGLCYLYGTLCEQFIKEHPQVDLTIIATESTEDVMVKVSRRAADIGFTALPAVLPDLEEVLLGTAEQIFIVGTRHPLANQRTVSLEELRRHPFLRYLPGSGGRIASDQVFLSTGGYPPIMTESNDTELVKRIAAMGLAVALTPVFAAMTEIRSGRLVALRLASRRIEQQFGFVCRKDHRSRGLDLFKDICSAYAGARPQLMTLDSLSRRPKSETSRKTPAARRAARGGGKRARSK